MIGYQRPRLYCYPSGTIGSIGQEATELAAHAGLFLDDWQSWSLSNILSYKTGGLWSAFEAAEIVGRQNGKGSILEARELAGLYLIPTDVYIAHTAHEFKTARKHFYRLKFLIDNTPELSRRVAPGGISEAHGQEGIELRPKPTLIMGADSKFVRRGIAKIFEVIARTGGSGRGFTGDLLVYDEAMILDALKVGATLPTLSARPNPQVIYMASAGFKTSTQLAKIRRRALEGGGKSLFFGEWSIEPCDDYCNPDCDKHDIPGTEESYRKSNPAYGIRINAEYLENERVGFESEAEWLRERLGVGEYPAPLDAWLVIPKKWWEATLDNAEDLPRVRGAVFAVDTAPDRSVTTIAVAGVRPDGLIQIEIVDKRPGTGWVMARMAELNNRYKPVFVVDKRAAAGSMIDDMEKAGFRIEAMTATDVSYACGQIYDAFRDDLLRHGKEDALGKAIAGCDKRPLIESWAFDRKNAAVDLTPLMATAFALWGYMKFGNGDYDIAKSVHFNLDEIIRTVRAGVYGPDDLQRLKLEGLITEDDIATILDALRENGN